MRLLRFLFASLLIAGLASTSALAQEGTPPLPHENWSFNSIFGTFDMAALQRGFQVYAQICSNCHSMKQLHYRDLEGIGLSPAQVKAIAAQFQVPKGVDGAGNAITGPATPADRFRSPFPNEEAARAANNGAAPPDLSVIVNARAGHANYVYGILTGFTKPPPGFKVPPGLYYNKYFPGHKIHMPPPLHPGEVTYADGTKASVDQMAHDVVTYLEWASNPNLVQRKQIGARVVLFLLLMTGLTYAVKRKIWSDVH